MKDQISYSVVIRTLGNTGEKYNRLLQSIAKQTVVPKEIIVVIPYGYDLDYKLGNERIVYCEKGMVTQRAIGIQQASSEYMLVVDDDLEFPIDFVERVYEYLMEYQLDCALCFGGYDVTKEVRSISFKEKMNNFLKRVRGAYTGQSFISNRKSPFFDKITVTAGHKTYANGGVNGCRYAQTGCFQCFFVKTKTAQDVHLEEEKWLEDGSISRYAAYDDAVYFYKLFLQGGKIAYADNTDYAHLDAAIGRQSKDKVTAKRIRLYTIAKNRTIFWYKFIWQQRNSFGRGVYVLMGGVYAFLNYTIYNLIINCIPKYWSVISAMFHGYKEAFSYIRKIR